MSLFQCEHCGCCENTALSWQGFAQFIVDGCDWTGIEARRGKKLCSACGPSKWTSGEPTECGKWHGRFPRVFLPLGMFRTAGNGNLEHIETGDQDYRKYAVEPCKRCGGPMKPSKAITQPLVGSPDFPGDSGTERGSTLSPQTRGPGELVDCMKCESCGWSVTS